MSNTQKPDYGEPWFEQTAVINKSVHRLNTDEFNRAVACVNACAGMVDPAAEIQAMRDSIKEAHTIIRVLYMDALDNHKESWERANLWMQKHEHIDQ